MILKKKKKKKVWKLEQQNTAQVFCSKASGKRLFPVSSRDLCLKYQKDVIKEV